MDFTQIADYGYVVAALGGAVLGVVGAKITAAVAHERTLYGRLARVENRLDECESQHRECKDRLADFEQRLGPVTS